MKQMLFLTMLLIGSIQVYSQDDIPILNEVNAEVNPLDTLTFDEIIAYNINFDSINNRKILSRDVMHIKDYDLNSKQASSKRVIDSMLFDHIITLFSDTATYGDNYADCFVPRFVLQFNYLGQEHFRIAICEDCGFLQSTQPIPAAYLKYYDVQYEDGGKEVIYRRYLKGFSLDGTMKINALCETLQMGYCKKNGSIEK